MPFACPFPLTRRVGQASVLRHVSCSIDSRLVSTLRYIPSKRLHCVPALTYPQLESTSRCSPSRGRYNVTVSHSGHDRKGACLYESPARATLKARQSPAWPLRQRGSYLCIHASTSSHKDGTVASKSPSLRTALLLAARQGIAPTLRVNRSDISFTNKISHDWNIPVDEDSPSDHANLNDRYLSGHESSQESSSILHALLARHIVQLTQNPHLNVNATVVSDSDRQTLSYHGLRIADLRRWITILVTSHSLHGAELLTGAYATPSFLYLYFLRRRQISPEALRLLVSHLATWYKIMVTTTSTDRLNISGSVGSADLVPQHSAFFRAWMRLLYHARCVWPEALVTITESLVSTLQLSTRAETAMLQGDMPVQQISRITKLFNRALYLIAEPVATEPFKSAVHQEAAQAVILRHMAEHNPPLIINREGYRGVMRVQLMHKKTPNEVEWARLKSLSWPPWKEDRTGMDADIGLEHGISRARHILNRMQEAGYSMQLWERVALVYAGWDSDLSPTIQTRARMPAMSSSYNRDMLHVWAARIRSTRTVEQAWACFLSCEDGGLQPDQNVYLAMLEKLVEEQKRGRLGAAHPSQGSHRGHDTSPVYPGDVKEVFPPPMSIHQATYTKTPPPTVHELHHRMLKNGSALTGRTLAFLINNSSSLGEGLEYLVQSGFREVLHHKLGEANLKHVPTSVFTALIRLLTRFPHTALNRSDGVSGVYRYGIWDVDLAQPLGRAIFLLDQERRQHRPAWTELFRGLNRRDPPTLSRDWRSIHEKRASDIESKWESQALDRIMAYKLTRHSLSVMQETDVTLDVVGFTHFCNIAEYAAKAAAQIAVGYEARNGSQEAHPGAHAYPDTINLQGEAAFLREQFRTLVGRRAVELEQSSAPSNPVTRLPRLLVTPNPAVLHAYVRALGFLNDYEGLLQLVEWMQEYWSEVKERRYRDRNGGAMFRRCIVALRVFLEGHVEADMGLQDSEQYANDDIVNVDGEEEEIYDNRTNDMAAPAELVGKTRDLVNANEDWEGWASDKEVEQYMDRM